jgi:hypothetical protein
MVGTIVSIVYGAGEWPARKAIWAHLFGSIAGGLLLSFGAFVVAQAVSSAGSMPPAAPMLIGSAIAAVYVPRELGILKVPYPQLRRQVPSWWHLAMKPGAYSFLYGVVLGTGVSVHIYTASFFPPLAYALADGGVRVSLVFGLSYGLGRGLAIMWIGWLGRRRGWRHTNEAALYLEDRRALVRPANALILASAALLFMRLALSKLG